MTSSSERACLSSTEVSKLDKFCLSIRTEEGSLRQIDTEALVSRYRRFFRLPISHSVESLHKHCRDLGIDELKIGNLPSDISAYNQEHRGKGLIILNKDHWMGIYTACIFHELYEILDRRFANHFTDYVRLSGQALEDKANKFAACMLMSGATVADLPNLLAVAPYLELHLGERGLRSILRRVEAAAGPAGLVLFIKYSKSRSDRGRLSLRVERIWHAKQKDFMPRKAMKILKNLLPKKGDSCEQNWMPRKCRSFQGPVLLVENTGFDLFHKYDISLFCVPAFQDSVVSNIFLVGVRGEARNAAIETMKRLGSRVIPKDYQRL